MSEHTELARPSSSRPDVGELTGSLTTWLAAQLPPDAHPVIEDVDIPTSAGMSSETVLFTARWGVDREPAELVARVAPVEDAVPVFPRYAMGEQFHTMRLVRAHSEVPVPEVLWLEEDPGVLGAPFFVMRRAYGAVPPDVMPYNFESWVTAASAEQQANLAANTVDILAALHGIRDPLGRFGFLNESSLSGPGQSGETLDAPGNSLLAAHIDGQRAYHRWIAERGPDAPIIGRLFDHLDRTWPGQPSDPVLCWGDARIGNVMYRDFRPVAVLDWEMTALAPPELDLGWLIFFHRWFEDIATAAGLPGLPDLFTIDRVCARYRETTGREPRDLEFYLCYAALRNALIMLRIQHRAIHFGQAEVPRDPDDLLMNRPALERMLEGSYWLG
ncbi:phosphotransferase family protein [Sciscionella sediminilitoris]|uniref:phosphotransferase family protein n=1 Tax=Sciscionella sediminilitoris TaxID=1445613 RepID=UPI0004DF46BC|nr:phosphotransferase family protein [Sciscionella sp. SE31]